ncbi:MAG TPA: hypothetical protein VFQ68_19500 [Streptosporangiaceae bacterium]|nr:hypothetical protein [Streptosporangiaceae bacterium]
MTPELTADMSAAPEIALLAAAVQAPAIPSAGTPASPPLTLGTMARRLRMLAAAPERWWGLVRFDPARSVLIGVEDQPEYGAWLVVLPPGDAGRDCDCDVATLIAGEAAEGAALHPGRVRVHGRRHWLRGHGAGYSISLHVRTVHARTVHARTAPGQVARAGFSAAESPASREFAIQRPVTFG